MMELRKGNTNMVQPLAVKDVDATHVVIEMFGGDNNLSAYVNRDLNEMDAGKGDLLTVLALVDQAGMSNSKIIEISPRHGLVGVENLGEINTGDPDMLAKFLASALLSYPKAQRHAVGFWDHGTGVFDEFQPRGGNPLDRPREVRTTPARSSARRLFFRDKSRLTDRYRAMLHDDTNGDLLTNKEAGVMLAKAFGMAGFSEKNKKVDMIFSDTCLNGMVEVLTQFAPFTHVITASEELEPGDGWDYKRWFAKLAQKPPAEASDWGKTAVEAYEEAYVNRTLEHPVTLAAFWTNVDLTAPFKQLVDVLTPLGQDGFDTVQLARGQTQNFAKRNTYDLRDFAGKLAAKAKSEPTVVAACQAIIEAFDQARIASVHCGDKVKAAQGLALWIPVDRGSFEDVASTYKELDFASKTGWYEYLGRFYV